jgi:hypothetical protein
MATDHKQTGLALMNGDIALYYCREEMIDENLAQVGGSNQFKLLNDLKKKTASILHYNLISRSSFIQ